MRPINGQLSEARLNDLRWEHRDNADVVAVIDSLNEERANNRSLRLEIKRLEKELREVGMDDE